MSKPSDLTCTDLFCGAGGSSLGATNAGARLRMALNHWELAIETHNTNFPDADHDCTDVSATDPRRYPSTNILIASPECTNHSLAKGQKRKVGQRDLFTPVSDDPAAVRSRATMWDVPRFAEFHGYDVVIVENVVDARRWVPYEAWLHAMRSLGYEHQTVYLNSMFAHPTPQSRDRMYVVFWKRGNRKPNLEIRPPAHCPKCDTTVESVQSWKPNRTWGRFDRQYVYMCPGCATQVKPYYFAALNALDLSIPGERIGDRSRPLKPRTLERIQYGLEKYGGDPLVVMTNMTNRVGGRVRSAVEREQFTQTGCNNLALVSPTIVCAGSREVGARSAADALPTQTGSERLALASRAAFMVTLRRNNAAKGLDEPLDTVCAGGDHHGVVIRGAALITLRDHPRMVMGRLSEVLPTQVATATQTWVASKAPFLVQYYGTGGTSRSDGPIPTLTSVDRHGLVEPGEEPAIEDCYFRMLQPHEIQRGMAFPDSYEVLGSKRDKVKQLGNAVTPPVMELLMQRAIESLEGPGTSANTN